MKKLTKRSVFSVVLALMLVFSVGFYSSAEPTTAWFTAFGDKEKEFQMDTIDIEYSGINENETAEFTFDVSTRFYDADERSKMFEYACKFFTVTLTNKGERDALVFIDVTDSAAAREAAVDKGVRYYIYEYTSRVSYAADAVSEIVPGVYETAYIDDVTGATKYHRVLKDNDGYFRTDKMIAQILDEKIAASSLDVANMTGEEQKEFLATSSLIELDAGETKSFCCAVWVEEEYFNNDEIVEFDENGTRILKCNLDVLVNAVQAEHYPVQQETTSEQS